MRRRVSFVLGSLLIGGVLAGCGSSGPQVPPFYLNLAQRDVEIDAAAAQTMISRYRANKGLSALRVDPVLQRVASQQAAAMAAHGRVDVSLERGNALRARLDRVGYPAGPAVENVSAGYHTLADAFSGWRGSPRHDANMRNAHVTRMGIATAYAPGNKYKVFWSLVLAGPETALDSAPEPAGASAADPTPSPAAKP